MNPRNTLVLAGLVAALGAFVWFYEIRGAEARDEAAAAEKRLYPGVEADSLTAIELTTTDGVDARLERDAGVWTLTRPLEFPADAAAAEGLAGSLASLVSEASFDEPAPLVEYGLDGDPLVRFEAGETAGVLRVGKAAPVGSHTYVATAADAPVHTVATYRATALRKSLDDLREKRILDFDERQLRKLALRWPEGGVALERESETAPWKMIEPLADAADGSTVDRLVSDLRYLRAVGFDDAPGDDEALGLAPPAFAADLELASGAEETRRVSVAIGSATADDTRAVRGERAGMVFEIAAAGLDDFPRRVDAYRDRELLRFAAGDAARIELVFADGGEGHVFVAERGAEGWASQPESVEPERLTRLVTELAGLRAESIAAESAGPEELVGMGLEPPRVRIRVFAGSAADAEEADPEVLGELEIGSTTAGRGFVARRPDRSTVFLVESSLAEHIPTSLGALRNRFVAVPDEAPPGEPSAGIETPTGPDEAEDVPAVAPELD